jgi:MerR family transcriptional regulator, heat shock protein HspR
MGGFVMAKKDDARTFLISVAAELAGMHAQTLRTYDRLGLVSPGRTGGGGRRYSWRDIELLREIADLSSTGIGLEGVRRILDLELQVEALRLRVNELEQDLAVADEALRRARRPGPSGPNLPAVRTTTAPQSGTVTVWRRRR